MNLEESREAAKIKSIMNGKHRDVFIAMLEGKPVEEKLPSGLWAISENPTFHDSEEYRIYNPENWRVDYRADQAAGQWFKFTGDNGDVHFNDDCGGGFEFEENEQHQYERVPPKEVTKTPNPAAPQAPDRFDPFHVEVFQAGDGTKVKIPNFMGFLASIPDSLRVSLNDALKIAYNSADSKDKITKYGIVMTLIIEGSILHWAAARATEERKAKAAKEGGENGK